MYPSQHIRLGFAFSLVLLIIFPKIGIIGFLLIFLSSFLLDIDHYLLYVYRKKDVSIKNALRWNFALDKKYLSLPKGSRALTYPGNVVFHGFEVAVILALLALFISKLFLFILTGVVFHLFLDVIWTRKKIKRVDRISILADYLKSKKLQILDDGDIMPELKQKQKKKHRKN